MNPAGHKPSALFCRLAFASIAILGAGCCRPAVYSNPPASAGKADHKQSYDRALELYHAGSYAEALRLFTELRDGGFRPDLSDNAQYWMGECYDALQNRAQAAAAFKKVVLDYKHSDKRDDALYKLGLFYMRSGECQKASCYFIQLRDECPGSEYRREAESALLKCGDFPCL